jgi:hypothetical protein
MFRGAAVSRVEELESQIKVLSSQELRELRTWLAEYDGELWDRQFEADVAAGRLDAVADHALKDLLNHRSTEL